MAALAWFDSLRSRRVCLVDGVEILRDSGPRKTERRGVSWSTARVSKEARAVFSWRGSAVGRRERPAGAKSLSLASTLWPARLQRRTLHRRRAAPRLRIARVSGGNREQAGWRMASFRPERPRRAPQPLGGGNPTFARGRGRAPPPLGARLRTNGAAIRPLPLGLLQKIGMFPPFRPFRGGGGAPKMPLGGPHESRWQSVLADLVEDRHE